MPEFKNKEEYAKWKVEKAKATEQKKSESSSKKIRGFDASPGAAGMQNEENKRIQKPKQGVKKSIAKSGLLILLSLFIGVVLLILAKNFNEAKKYYLRGTFDVYFAVKTTADTKEGKSLSYVRVKFPLETNEAIIEGILKRDFEEFFKIVGARNGESKHIIGIKEAVSVMSDQEKLLLLDTLSSVGAYYDQDGNKLWQYSDTLDGFLNFAYLFFLIIFPPVYLLLKFITWAIRTLREKPATQV